MSSNASSSYSSWSRDNATNGSPIGDAAPAQMVPTNGVQVVPPNALEVREPQPPPSMPPEEIESYRQRAIAIAADLEKARGSKELALADSVSGLGIQAQRQSGAELALLRARVGDMLSRDSTGSQIAKELIDLRVALRQIDPNELSQPSFWRRLSRFLPFVENSKPLLKVLERIAARYETTVSHVQVIETRLVEGRRLLARDNIELRKLYEGVEEQQAPIDKHIYLGEVLTLELARLLERTDDPLKKERVTNALHDVAMRVQDLRTMQEVYQQFFVSIEMSRQNNSRLGQAVERTVSLATTMVTVGLAIQTALARQKRVLEATRATQEFLGQMLAANAAAIKQHTHEIGDIYNNPVIALDKITQAHRDLLEAMATVQRVKEEGIQSARQNNIRLAKLSEEMQYKLGSLQAGPETEPIT